MTIADLQEARFRSFNAVLRTTRARDAKDHKAHEVALIDLEEAREHCRAVMARVEALPCANESCGHRRSEHKHFCTGVWECGVDGCRCQYWRES